MKIIFDLSVSGWLLVGERWMSHQGNWWLQSIFNVSYKTSKRQIPVSTFCPFRGLRKRHPLLMCIFSTMSRNMKIFRVSTSWAHTVSVFPNKSPRLLLSWIGVRDSYDGMGSRIPSHPIPSLWGLTEEDCTQPDRIVNSTPGLHQLDRVASNRMLARWR